MKEFRRKGKKKIKANKYWIQKHQEITVKKGSDTQTESRENCAFRVPNVWELKRLPGFRLITPARKWFCVGVWRKKDTPPCGVELLIPPSCGGEGHIHFVPQSKCTVAHIVHGKSEKKKKKGLKEKFKLWK